MVQQSHLIRIPMVPPLHSWQSRSVMHDRWCFLGFLPILHGRYTVQQLRCDSLAPRFWHNFQSKSRKVSIKSTRTPSKLATGPSVKMFINDLPFFRRGFLCFRRPHLVASAMFSFHWKWNATTMRMYRNPTQLPVTSNLSNVNKCCP